MKLVPVTGIPEQKTSSASGLNPQRVSILLFKDGSTQSGAWVSIDKTGRILEGSDETGLSKLSHGAWIVNLPFSDMQSLREVVGPGVLLKSQDWARTRMDLIMEEWGIDLKTSPLPTAAQASYDIFGRLLDGCFEAMHEVCTTSAKSNVRDFAKTTHSLEGQPSLSTFIRKFIEPWLDADLPAGGNMKDILKSSFLAGSGQTLKVGGDGTIRLRLFRPRLTHARDILSKPVPSGSDWLQAETVANDTVESVLDWGRENNRPVLILGSASHGSISPAMTGWVARKSVVRQVFPDAEAYLLRDNISLSGAIVGASMSDTQTKNISKSLDALFGQKSLSSLSLTTGLIAENVLCSCLRGGRDGFPSSTTSWMAAADRILMAPLWSTLEMSGASVCHAYAGQLTVDVPDDVEVISAILSTAWECGLTLPLKSVVELNARGISVPSDRDGWGGTDDDYILASMVHRGRRSTLWKIDGCLSLPPTDRPDAVRKIIRGTNV